MKTIDRPSSPLFPLPVHSFLPMGEHRGSSEEVLRAVIRSTLERMRAQRTEPLDRATLLAICDEVLAKRAAHQMLLAANSRRIGRLEVVAELVRQSQSLRFSEPSQMVRVARAAVAVAEGLRNDTAQLCLVADARTEAWAHLANAYRIVGDLRRAEDAWHHADRNRESGSGDPLLDAKLCRLRGSLRQRQQRYPEAVDLLSRAIAIYLRLGDRRAAGRTQLVLGIVHHEMGDLAAASSLTIAGTRLLDGSREPSVVAGALKNVIFYLHQVGHSTDAEALLPFVRELVARDGKPVEILRLQWLEGKIAVASGRRVEARVALDAVRRGFVEHELPYDAALVSMELALLYAEVGSTAEVERLTTEMYPIFVSQDLPRHAAAVLLLFVQAVNEQSASPERIRELLARLEVRGGGFE